MLESRSASKGVERLAATMLVVAALTGCAGQQVGELQSDLEALQRRSAEQRGIQRRVSSENFVATPQSTPVDLAPAYLTVSEAARRSAERGSENPNNRVALYRVSGIAAWGAAAEAVGRSPASLKSARDEAIAARDQGVALCNTLGNAAPPRDCAVLALLPSLVELELAAGIWVDEVGPARQRPMVDQAERDAPFASAMTVFHDVAMTNDTVARALRARGFAPWLCAIHQGIATNARARWVAVSAAPGPKPGGVTEQAADAARRQATQNWRAFSQTRSPTECQPPPS
jgi:hypothetical protein